ncbi:LysR substrate-binding domain-containing protein [Kineosporia mesophila]|uniref:LysR substrate-binding domain-containing protein n=1 Tax=Kineosporia mesophila TaxID=566012 RepID=A0ABP7AWB4_9ACTN|nr:LysR family transcriptional regulator [Kineosporia mesophila]MCD5354086.1 LysR family transcriptional regulator [Kineosporia mesophila]
MFSFEQLRGFVAVAEELHFGRAATRLSMTQPPLSRLVQKLEREVGVRLFDRDSRGVRLTPAGTAFYGEARRLLALAESAPQQARRISEGSAGRLRVGFTAGAGYGVLPRLLNHLSAQLPDLELELFEMVSRDQVEAVQGHEIDLGLARPPFDAATFGHRLLMREALVVAVPDTHPLTRLDRPVHPEDLVAEPLIMHSDAKARYFYDLVVGLMPVRHDNVVHSVSQILTMVWLVQGGRGVALVPHSTELIRVDGVSFLPFATPTPKPVELHLLWARDSQNPALPVALEALRNQ